METRQPSCRTESQCQRVGEDSQEGPENIGIEKCLCLFQDEAQSPSSFNAACQEQSRNEKECRHVETVDESVGKLDRVFNTLTARPDLPMHGSLLSMTQDHQNNGKSFYRIHDGEPHFVRD